MEHKPYSPHYLILDIETFRLENLTWHLTEFEAQIVHRIPLSRGRVSLEVEFENIKKADDFLYKYGNLYFDVEDK